MKLMAIDASTKSTGVAIFEDKELIHYTCITSSSQDMLKRIKIMTEEIEKLYLKYKIDTIIMEDVLPEDVKHNQSVFNALHYLQGSVVLKMHDYKQKIELVNVNLWRGACGIKTGRYGVRESAKAQDMKFVKDKYNIDANDDICDAICIGWAKINNPNMLIPKAERVTSKPIGTEESAF